MSGAHGHEGLFGTRETATHVVAGVVPDLGTQPGLNCNLPEIAVWNWPLSYGRFILAAWVAPLLRVDELARQRPQMPLPGLFADEPRHA